jgi:hypothetical protein
VSLGDLDDDFLLYVLRVLQPHHRAIVRLVCRRLNALVGPVADRRLPLKPLLCERPLPWGCVWEASLMMLDISHSKQCRIAAAVAASGELEHLQLLWQHGFGWDAETCSQAAGGGHLAMLHVGGTGNGV